MLTLPNLFTILRLALTPFVALAILSGDYTRAIVLCFLAGLSDGVDGLLARKLGQASQFGAYLDPIADKILLSAVYISLGVAHDIEWWMVALVFGRDLFILAMAAYGFLFTTIRKFPPSVWGKISTFFQILAALAVLSYRAGLAVPIAPFLWSMIAATGWSGLHYAWHGITLLRSESS